MHESCVDSLISGHDSPSLDVALNLLTFLLCSRTPHMPPPLVVLAHSSNAHVEPF